MATTTVAAASSPIANATAKKTPLVAESAAVSP
jgi:hypothetical protein